jgi:hypothetical protein
MEASDSDVGDIVAWSAVFAHLLELVPRTKRAEVLAALTELVTARELPGSWTSPSRRDVVERLMALSTQVLIRTVVRRHDPTTAAKLLFAEQPYGSGSGYIADDLGRLPGVCLNHVVVARLGRL